MWGLRLSGALCLLPCSKEILIQNASGYFCEASINEFLLLEMHEIDVLPFLALHVYAVYGAVNHIRAGQLPRGSFDLDFLLWERWRAAMSQKSSLHHLLNERWRATRPLLR